MPMVGGNDAADRGPGAGPCWYNDNEPFAAGWLRALVRAGEIGGGTVDPRGIAEIGEADLRPDGGIVRRHFFAGIGGWELALRLAAWPAARPVWTASCPCQPFSTAGRGLGDGDHRHLWPELLRLVDVARPPTVFGEQVAGAAGMRWLAGVRRDLEARGYAVGAADLPAGGFGAPHRRQRLYWAAARPFPDADGRGRGAGVRYDGAREPLAARGGEAGAVPDPGGIGWERGAGGPRPVGEEAVGGEEVCDSGDRRGPVALPDPAGVVGRGRGDVAERGEEGRGADRGHRPWAGGIPVPFADGRTRRLEPGVVPLVDGFPGRVGALRGYGNAVVPQVAAAFVRAFLEAEREG